MDERILKFLYDIQKCISKIETYTKHQTQEDYLEDEKTQDDVEQNFEIIGESEIFSISSANIPKVP